jgi:hypothetical protein
VECQHGVTPNATSGRQRPARGFLGVYHQKAPGRMEAHDGTQEIYADKVASDLRRRNSIGARA